MDANQQHINKCCKMGVNEQHINYEKWIHTIEGSIKGFYIVNYNSKFIYELNKKIEYFINHHINV